MPVTIKIDDDANMLLDAYVGWQRAQGLGRVNGKRLNKEDVTNLCIRTYVTSNLPASLMRSILKQAEKATEKES